ncbi:HDOD domain-containing protein [Deefgea sp. CFH1-16]|uniref:HDOD domain-containing protein n=1 Tax=Deefgea sp. CFH1-16 TaxID=2675457 RepID=UPI0015F529BE|nr:GAF domain-containing protein [Deefgea sp. CFH1-16]MBM5575468.1 HDOD domain-containing protein [Deefgea sp. CFH1-16]
MANVKSVSNAWLQFWDRRAIPILQESRNQLMGMIRRADLIRPSEVAEIVARDPLLTAQVLRMMNQRQKSSMSADVVAIESAILLIGVTPFLERFARAQTVESVMLPAHQAEYGQLLKRVFEARLARRLATVFANKRFDAKLGEIQAAAVLANLCESLAIISPHLDEQAPAASLDLLNLLEQWQMPTAILDLIRVDAEPATRSVLQHAVVPLSRQLDRGWWQDEIQQRLLTIAGVLNFPPEQVWQLLTEQLLAFARKEGKSSQLYTPARYLVMLPGAWPTPARTAPAANLAAAIPAKDLLAERMQALHLAGVQGVPTNQVMALAVRALAEGLGMQRIAFTLLMAAENALRARYVQGVTPTDSLHALRISLEKQHIFTKLLQKPQSFWLNADNYTQFSPHLPPELVAQIGAKSFCAMSIFVGAQPVGLIYADSGLDGTVNEFHYTHFKNICILASKALAHNARRSSV